MIPGALDPLSKLNHLSRERAYAEFLRCCGSSQWAHTMTDRRPYRSTAQLFGVARTTWESLRREDWLEAFAQHPRIGDVESLKTKFASTASWAQGEQAGAAGADLGILEELAEGNRQYESKFGYIFIVCATGKSAAEMLSLLKFRLANSAAIELRLAANEQAKITRLRLEKLLAQQTPT